MNTNLTDHERIAAARLALAEAERRNAALTAEEALVRAQITTHTRTANMRELAEARRRAEALAGARKEHDAAVVGLKNSMSELLGQFVKHPDPATLFTLLESGSPVALLPVRLETRYFPGSDGGTELRIRVYPDDIHADTFEPELTEDEVRFGRVFWESTWRATGDRTRLVNVWGVLVGQAGGSPRAAWIAKSLTPKNHNDRPVMPLDESAPLPIPIDFPNPPRKGSAWTRPAVARVLPDRWVGLGYVDGNRTVTAWGNAIPDPLVISFAPDGPPPPPGEIPVDDAMRWMVDFNEAERVGMGLRMHFAAGQSPALTQLLVLGVKASADKRESASMLGRLLDSHHYDNGLAFVPQGTATNNSMAQPAGFSSREHDHAISYDAERGPALFAPGDNSDGARLTEVLRLDPAILSHIRNANGREYIDAGHMNVALWSATWGSYLNEMLNGVFGEARIDDTRGHFISYVRARGPFAAIRIGNQPYGILPAISLSQLQPRDSIFEIRLADILRKLRETWRSALPRVPRIGRTGDVDRDLIEVMAMEPLSGDYAARKVKGHEYTRTVFSFLGVNVDINWWQAQEALAALPLRQLGVVETPPIVRTLAEPGVKSLNRPLVQTEPLSETELLSPDYIALIRGASLRQLRDEQFPTPPPPALLYVLLRHAAMLEYKNAGFRIEAHDQDIPLATLMREAELVNVRATAPIKTVWEHLAQPVPRVTGGLSLERYLDTLLSYDLRDTVQLGQFRASLDHLRGRPTAVLDRLLRETLDLSVHRLDAWITSLAMPRLQRPPSVPGIVGGATNGIYLGGYGYVENLRPDPPRTQVDPPAGEEGSLIYRPDIEAGWLHAPSLSHAATAAVLRSGHLSHRGTGNANLLAVDLSSERVRLAEYLLDGVRQGQSLGALLGYRFERGLHENHPGIELDQFIFRFRELAPLVAKKLEQTAEAVEAIAANNVVDGHKLHRLFHKPGGIPFGAGGLPAVGSSEHAAILAELRLLDDAMDTLADAMLAESVHHAVQGNMLRAGATVDAIAAGDVPPPELEFVQTPRTGVALTHRLIRLFAPNPPAPANWPVNALQARAQAEPHLNAWAARLLPDPAQVIMRTEWRTPGGDVLASPRVALRDLQCSPLDLLYALEAAPNQPAGEIEQHFRYHLTRTPPPGLPPAAELFLLPDRDATLAATELSYTEFTMALRAVRRLVTEARPLTAADLTLPTDQPSFTVDVAELQTRVNAAAMAFRDAASTLETAATGATPDAETLRSAILRFAYFGMQATVPLSAAGAGLEVLLPQARSIAREAARRITALNAAEAGAAPTPEAERDRQMERLKLIFGPAFRVLPRFTAVNAAELQQGFSALPIPADHADAPLTWFTRSAHVRAGTGRLDEALRFAETLECAETLDLRAAQLPFQPGDRWIALSLDGARPEGGRVSLVAQGFDSSLDLTGALAGVLLDDWTEVIPGEAENTGVVFPHDAPGARAPQCLLLAVAPGTGPVWTLDTLEATVLETIELAKLRAVDIDELGSLGHYLPGLYFTFNVARDTISLDFLPLLIGATAITRT
ncbi:MAG: hypothetical protein ACKVX9_14685 [Blastocatellia bacterium]